MRKRRVWLLLVDDDVLFRQACIRLLNARGFDVEGVGSYREAEVLLRTNPPHLLLVDLDLGPDSRSGLELLELARTIAPQTLPIVISGTGSPILGFKAKELGAYDFVEKGDNAALIAACERATSANGTDGDRPLDAIERLHILRVIAESGGNKDKAARRLCISPRSLRDRLFKTPTPSR